MTSNVIWEYDCYCSNILVQQKLYFKVIWALHKVCKAKIVIFNKPRSPCHGGVTCPKPLFLQSLKEFFLRNNVNRWKKFRRTMIQSFRDKTWLWNPLPPCHILSRQLTTSSSVTCFTTNELTPKILNSSCVQFLLGFFLLKIVVHPQRLEMVELAWRQLSGPLG